MLNDMETISTNVQPDIHDQIEKYRETRNINKSEAIRRLIQEGLEAEQQDDIMTKLDDIDRSVKLFNERYIEEKNKTESYRRDARGKRKQIQRAAEKPRGFTETLKSIFKLR